MRYVELAVGVRSSVVGFGCAPVLGAVGSWEARQAIACALDNGVTHFDIARSYGYGEAEAFLGKTIHSKRDRVTIASKFGIQATWQARILRPLKPVVRTLRPKRKALADAWHPRKVLAPHKSRFQKKIELSPSVMRQSLELSLRALRTDYLDIYLIHEPSGPIDQVEELAEEANRLKHAGKIRAWGLAFNWEQLPTLRQDLHRFDLLQFNCSPGVGHYSEAARLYGNVPNVIFSAFRGAGADTDPKSTLRTLFSDFPRSVVVCSMFNLRHIIENVVAASEGEAHDAHPSV